jgi:hypothetical protein
VGLHAHPGGLKHLGHDVARNTIKGLLEDHGIDPAPERGTKTSWRTFLAAHCDGLAAATFRRLLRDSGVTPVVLPAWSPNLNASTNQLS